MFQHIDDKVVTFTGDDIDFNLGEASEFFIAHARTNLFAFQSEFNITRDVIAVSKCRGRQRDCVRKE